MEDEDKIFAFDPLVIGAMRFGTWGAGLDRAGYQGLIEGCLELGLSDFDHADIYGDYSTEAEFGEVLKDNSALRDKLRITTKCGIRMLAANRPDHKIKSYDLSGSHITKSVEQSLKNFHTDRIDVLLLHRPDVLMDPYEVVETFDQLQNEGKVLHFGVSNFTTEQFDSLNDLFPLITNQIEASLTHLDPFTDGTLAQCLSHDIQPMAWSPLGGGILFQPSDDPRIAHIIKTAEPLCDSYNCSLDQLLFAFLFSHPSGIVPVLGTSKITRIKAAVDATNITLTREDWYRLWEAATGKEVA